MVRRENAADHLEIDFRESEPDVEMQITRRWRGVSVQFCRLSLPAEFDFKCNGTSHYLAYHDIVLADGEMQVLGEKPIPGGDLRGLMTYVPAGCTIDGWAKPADRLNAFTVVHFDPSAMEEELQKEFSEYSPTPQIYFRHDELGATMRKLAKLMGTAGPIPEIYAETMGLSAALEMFQIGQTHSVRSSSSGQLTQLQAKMVRSYIEENLAGDLGLETLAALCRLTRFHFSRAFKSTFNESPHRYVILRRLDLAKQMLITTHLPVSEIGHLCGFNGVSRFGKVFRDVVGETPLQFRRQG